MTGRGARRVLRALVGVLLGTLGALLAGVAVAPVPAVACSCVDKPFVEHVAEADSIGLGEVAWIADGPQQRTIAVDFDQVYKGELGSREKVVTNTSGASCGLEVETAEESGERYLFLLDGTHRGRISASLCGGTTVTTPALEQRVEQLTGPPGDPVQVDASRIEEPESRWPWVVGGALLLAGAAGWWVVRRAR